MRKTEYMINGTKAKVISRTSATVTYITEIGVKCRVGVKWFANNAKAVR